MRMTHFTGLRKTAVAAWSSVEIRWIKNPTIGKKVKVYTRWTKVIKIKKRA